MKIQIEKNALLSALSLAASVADKKSTMPILGNVLLRTEGRDKLLVAATDLSITVTAEIACKVLSEGAHTIGAKNAHEIVKSLPGASLTYEKLDNQFAEILANKSRFKVVGLADRDFPKLPDHREIEFQNVEASAVVALIDRVSDSVSTDETRHHLNGAHVRGDGKATIATATDGHRLARASASLAIETHTKGVIIPRKAILEMRRILDAVTGEVGIGFDKSYVYVQAGATVLAAKLADAEFPPTDQVIPKESDRVILAPRLSLIEAVKRIAIMSSDKTRGVRLGFESGELTITADNPDLGEGRETLDVEYDGAPLTIGFNGRYLLDALACAEGERVRLMLNGELDPLLLKPVDDDSFAAVVMPMRL